MKLVLLACATLASIALSSPARAQCSSLTTLFATNNGLGGNSQIFFDLQVNNAAGVTIDSIDTNTSVSVGTAFTVTVFVKSGSYVGNDTNSSAWTQVSTGNGTAAGTNQPSVVDLTDFTLAPGAWGVAFGFTTAGAAYTDGNGSNQMYSNADVTLTAGMSHSVWWAGSAFSPRVWNGTIRYNCAPSAPVTFCTAGTSSNGCTPSLTASAQPSVSLAHACVLSVANLDGQKAGIVFYGIDNTGWVPQTWAAGSTSFLCVKPPTQRTLTQNSGGTLGGCNGSLALDWNAFQSANPGSLGAPWMVGEKVFAQGWYRDPPAPKTTNLTDAVELTYVP
jgi:hypothetical protein